MKPRDMLRIGDTSSLERVEFDPNYNFNSQILNDSHTAFTDAVDRLESMEVGSPEAEEAVEEAIAARDELAQQLFLLYEESGSANTFLSQLGDTNQSLFETVMGQQTNHGEQHLTERGAVPLEQSVLATVRNLEIAEEFAAAARDNAESVILFGSHAYGPFYSVQGEVPLSNGAERVKPSDIDLTVVVRDIDQLRTAIAGYVEAGLVDEFELERLTVFEHLHAEGLADMFSVRASYRDVEESLHFIPQELVGQITDLEPVSPRLVDRVGLDAIKDLRPNIPGNLRRHGHYPTGDLKGMAQFPLQPKLLKIHTAQRQEAGWLSDTPIGGPAKFGKTETYFLGVVPFFLLVTPRILYDREAATIRQIQQFRHNLAAIMDGDELRYLPRQEKMPPSAIAAVKKSLL